MAEDRKVIGRRDFLKLTATTGLVFGAVSCGATPVPSVTTKKGTISLADIGVGDPGDWSKFTNATGWEVNLVSIGNAPAGILNTLIAGGGTQVYDIANIVGGMQQPLVEDQLTEVIDTSRLPNWNRNTYIRDFFGPGTPGFEFISYQDTIYGVPTVLQGDSFAYLPDKTGPLDTYGALFDPKWKGYVALEDNFSTAGQKTALYLKANKLASINDPRNMTPTEIKTTIDFLIQKKREGQFHTIWNSFDQAVNLLTRQEVYVMDAWEPMVFAAKKQGMNAAYAVPKEGYLLWAMVAYFVKKPKERSAENRQAVYDLLNFLLDPWYGAKITLLRGYMTNSDAISYVHDHPTEFSPTDAQDIEAIHTAVKKKLQQGGTWQNRWPTHLQEYESQWARFKAAPSS